MNGKNVHTPRFLLIYVDMFYKSVHNLL